jgi:hypothetical protein
MISLYERQAGYFFKMGRGLRGQAGQYVKFFIEFERHFDFFLANAWKFSGVLFCCSSTAGFYMRI